MVVYSAITLTYQSLNSEDIHDKFITVSETYC